MVEPMIRISEVILFSSFLLVGVMMAARPSRNANPNDLATYTYSEYLVL